MVAELDRTVRCVAEKLFQRRLALDRWLLAVVFAVEVEQIRNPPPETFGTSASWHGRGDGTWASVASPRGHRGSDSDQ